MPKNEHTTNKGKNKQIHTIMEHKTVINITEFNKYKKLNMTEHKTDMNNAKIDKYKKNKTKPAIL